VDDLRRTIRIMATESPTSMATEYCIYSTLTPDTIVRLEVDYKFIISRETSVAIMREAVDAAVDKYIQWLSKNLLPEVSSM
jgi:hypothetical protein